MKKLATELIKGDLVKSGNVKGTIIDVNENYSTKNQICYNVKTESCTIKRRGGIYKNTEYSGCIEYFYFRKTTLVEIF